jgi:quinate dehydrogenase (quinone)
MAATARNGDGLIFIGGVLDSTMRGIDLFTGKEVWSDSLPTSSQATPMTYVSPKTGRQYVLGTVPDGGTSMALESAEREKRDDADVEGGYVIAYRLPD